jgi:hypothetical protein
MNTSQLLKVAIKVFVNWDQEAKWEANRKMRGKKVDLLAAALFKQSGRPQRTNLDRGRGSHHGQWSVPPEHPHLREKLGQNQCAYCHQKGHWKNKCPQWARGSWRAPQTRDIGQIVEQKYQHTSSGKPTPGRKTLLNWQP